jgi:hypothetical protein
MTEVNRFNGDHSDLSLRDQALLEADDNGGSETPPPAPEQEVQPSDAGQETPPSNPEQETPLNGPETGGRNFLDAAREKLAKLGNDLKS